MTSSLLSLLGDGAASLCRRPARRQRVQRNRWSRASFIDPERNPRGSSDGLVEAGVTDGVEHRRLPRPPGTSWPGEQDGVDLDRATLAEVTHPQVAGGRPGVGEHAAYGGLGALDPRQPVRA